MRVAVVGLGLMGTRRAAIAHAHDQSRVTRVCDLSPERTRRSASQFQAIGCASWQECIDDQEIDTVIVSTSNAIKDVITAHALRNGKAVLAEKPPARDMSGLRKILLALDEAGGLLKIGFNYRYFRGLRDARQAVASGEIGDLVNYRLRHGHGGRPGYADDWRFDLAVSGGGELADQGCHALDLGMWFAGPITKSCCELQSAVWAGQGVEDNAFVTVRHGDVAGQIHVSWTHWKNLFSLEVFGTQGAIVVEGLGGSYGRQHLVRYARASTGGPPSEHHRSYPAEDAMSALRREWQDFAGAAADPAGRRGEWRDQARQCAEAIDCLYLSSGRAERSSRSPSP